MTAKRDKRGWFADVAQRDDESAPRDAWQPCLELDNGIIPCFDIWFVTKDECEAFIREEVIPAAGRMVDATRDGEDA